MRGRSSQRTLLVLHALLLVMASTEVAPLTGWSVAPKQGVKAGSKAASKAKPSAYQAVSVRGPKQPQSITILGKGTEGKEMESVQLDLSAGEDSYDYRALNIDAPQSVETAPGTSLNLKKPVSSLKIQPVNPLTKLPAAAPKIFPGTSPAIPIAPFENDLEADNFSPVNTGKTLTLDESDFDTPLEAKAVVVDIVSDTLDYDNKTNLYTATGSVQVMISEQNTELTAKKVVYDKEKELMVAEGDVVINNKGEKTYGTYAKIDLTRKSALINDPIARLEQVRIKAREGLVGDNNYMELHDGKLVIPATAPVAGVNDEFMDRADAGDLSKMAIADPLLKQDNGSGKVKNGKVQKTVAAPTYENSLVTKEMDVSWDVPQEGLRSKFKLHSKNVEIIRGEDGFNEINLLNPELRFGKFKVASLPQMDFINDEAQGWTEYLGPDIGIDPDLGGLYAGPGWDFRLGKGVVKASPIASMGVGARRTRGGRDIQRSTGLGAGVFLNYMSPETRSWFAYSTQTDTPIFMYDRKLGSGKTHVMLGANEDYTLGFVGWERPKYIGQIYDSRKIYGNDTSLFRIDTFAAAGVAKDELFPTSQEDFFVERDKEDQDKDPLTAGRIQLQAQIRNNKPLLHIGNTHNFLDLGWTAQAATAAYSTGDFVGVFRLGPSSVLTLGDRFRSINRYFYAATAGESPFVFDQYYRGRNNVQSINQFRVNRYLTVGLRSNMALNKDNAQGSLFTGNSFFLLMGPDDVKFNIAYDFVRQRSFFGLNFIPGANRKTLHYDQLQMYQPADYGLISRTPSNTANPLANQDVGMMNGMKAP